MANPHTSGAVTGTGDRSRPRAALRALCLTQVISRGTGHHEGGQP
ncbi:hypothetical protein BJ965_004619 [Streptomyces luteogriseus]|uniref:Uncharacterized protein n=1 Tax=Streptomyces luteogriseus TaxID=68233 RepID=A0A7W7GGW2_9ACTN|nr:hypothetical protein [Streptomyces luteogriseus]MBB4714737.1 hypothetical protein [Streptomyces luteogriseus]